jgi:hypothetical protein
MGIATSWLNLLAAVNGCKRKELSRMAGNWSDCLLVCFCVWGFRRATSLIYLLPAQ